MKHTHQLLIHRYRKAIKRFQKFQQRFDHAIREGGATFKLLKLSQQLARFKQKLARLRNRLELTGMTLVVGGLLMATEPVTAQVTPELEYNFGIANVDYFRHTLVDIDHDGDFDLFTGTEQGNIEYFENTGDRVSPAFAASVENPFGFTDAGSKTNISFADLDGDGDLDAYLGDNGGSVRYFENTGDKFNPTFAAISTNPFGFTDVGNESKTSFADLDGDGDLDACIGERNGNLFFFENTGNSANPTFAAAVQNPFGFTDIGTMNYPNFADIDDDGDLDAFIGDRYNVINYFENVGNSTNPTFATVSLNPFNLFSLNTGLSVTFADLDDDGDLDAFGGATHFAAYFENIGDKTNPNFSSLYHSPFNLTNTTSNFLDPAFADLDGDGDLDALVGEQSGNFLYFQNTGNSTNPAFNAPSMNPLGLSNLTLLTSPSFADLDGDGDLDVFVAFFSGAIRYFENTGDSTNPTFTSAGNNPFGLADVGATVRITFADLDGDDDLDAFLGESGGNIKYFENTGNSSNPTFAAVADNPFGLTNVGASSSPSFADLDVDGDLDAFIGRQEGGDIVFFENTGDHTNPTFAAAVVNPFGNTGYTVDGATLPEFADLDGDDDLDLIVGREVTRLLFYYENVTPATWDGTTWIPGPPAGDTDITINNDYNTGTDGAISCDNLTINASFTLTVNSGAPVVVAQEVTNAGSIIVEHNAAFVQSNITPSNSGSGTYTVQREGSTYFQDFNYWSSPLQSITLGDISGWESQNLYSFNATTQAWSSETTGTTMAVATGYTASGNTESPGTTLRTFSNTSGFNSGTITKTLTFNSDADSDNDWNLIGNPYPSGIDVAAFLATNYNGGTGPIANAVYLWNSDGNDHVSSDTDYAIMNSAGVANAGGNTAPTSATIASCQGFFVQVTAAGNVTFENTHRITTNNTFLRTSDQKAGWQRLWLGVTVNDQYANEILIGFMPDAKTGKDQYDAQKLSGSSQLSFYSFPACTGEKPLAPIPCASANELGKLAIQGLPTLTDEIKIPLGLEAKTTGTYRFQINHAINLAAYEVVLVDRLTEKFSDLRDQTFQIKLEEGTYEDRFELLIGQRITQLNTEWTPATLDLYAHQNKIYFKNRKGDQVRVQVKVMDVLGKAVWESKLLLDANPEPIVMDSMKPGIYLVQVETEEGMFVKRVWLQN
ncbi:MAG: FG-GAP-like repeat-containing protein [Flammeovirgaceae bacterium]